MSQYPLHADAMPVPFRVEHRSFGIIFMAETHLNA
jgi:hypothetical protein